jgi:hypothetical protein
MAYANTFPVALTRLDVVRRLIVAGLEAVERPGTRR